MKIKVYHLDDPNLGYPSKTNGIYPYTPNWGCIITNKAKRSDRNFADWFSPDGTKRCQLTRKMFNQLTPLMEHIYALSDTKLKEYRCQFRKLNTNDLIRLKSELDDVLIIKQCPDHH